VGIDSGLLPDGRWVITIQYSRYQQHGGFKMWSRGFGPSTTPLREVKSELLLQIERDLLRLVERSSSRLSKDGGLG
jgi:hypothetical protein